MKFNKDAASTFLELLDPSADEFIFQCFHPDRKIKPTGSIVGDIDDCWDVLCKWNREGYGVYVTINRSTGGRRRIKDITGIRAFWQEDDDGWDGTFPKGLRPSIIVNTSPGKYHRYFLVNRDDQTRISKDQFDAVQQALVNDYGSDKNSWDITRVLRVPGFYNTKEKNKKKNKYGVMVELVEGNGHSYSLKKLQKKFKAGNFAKKKKNEVEKAAEQFYNDTGDFDYNKAINEISQANSYYQPLLKWAMHLANRDVPAEGAKAILRMALELGKQFRPSQDMDIWQERYDGIDQMVDSAISKANDDRKLKNREIISEEDLEQIIITGEELSSESLDEDVFWIKPIITDASINMIHAARGLGKTFFAMSMASAMASKKDFLKWNKVRKAKVLYIDGELPYARLQKQFKIASRAVGAKKPKIHFLTGDRMPDKLMPDFCDYRMMDEVTNIIMRNGYNVVVFDNLATLFRSAEEKQQNWKEIQSWLISLRTKGVTSILIHHDNKEGLAQRGFSNKEDVMDTVIHLMKPKNYTDEDGAKFNVVFNKKRYIEGKDGASFGCELRKPDGWKNPIWVIGELFGNNYEMAIEYFRDGATANEVTRFLNVSAGLVAKYKKRAIEEGVLTLEDINTGYKNNFDEYNKDKNRKTRKGKGNKDKSKVKGAFDKKDETSGGVDNTENMKN